MESSFTVEEKTFKYGKGECQNESKVSYWTFKYRHALTDIEIIVDNKNYVCLWPIYINTHAYISQLYTCPGPGTSKTPVEIKIRRTLTLVYK